MKNDYCLITDDAGKDTRYWYQKMWNHINPQAASEATQCLLYV